MSLKIITDKTSYNLSLMGIKEAQLKFCGNYLKFLKVKGKYVVKIRIYWLFTFIFYEFSNYLTLKNSMGIMGIGM